MLAITPNLTCSKSIIMSYLANYKNQSVCVFRKGSASQEPTGHSL